MWSHLLSVICPSELHELLTMAELAFEAASIHYSAEVAPPSFHSCITTGYVIQVEYMYVYVHV